MEKKFYKAPQFYLFKGECCHADVLVASNGEYEETGDDIIEW